MWTEKLKAKTVASSAWPLILCHPHHNRPWHAIWPLPGAGWSDVLLRNLIPIKRIAQLLLTPVSPPDPHQSHWYEATSSFEMLTILLLLTGPPSKSSPFLHPPSLPLSSLETSGSHHHWDDFLSTWMIHQPLEPLHVLPSLRSVAVTSRTEPRTIPSELRTSTFPG